MQKVTLLPPIFEEHNKSMEVYAQELVRHFKEQALPLRPFLQNVHQSQEKNTIVPANFPVPLKTKLSDNLQFKYFVYPKRIQCLKDSLVHIIDHSYGHLLFSAPGNKVVITCHDLTLLKFQKKLAQSPEDIDKINLFKYSVQALKKASAVIADSKATQNDIARFLKIPKTKVHVVPLGVNFLFKPHDNEQAVETLRKKYQLHNKYILLHVGNNAFYKNISFLLKTLYILIKKYSLKIKLLKVGSDFTEFQKMMIRNLNLSEHILHLGHVPTNTLVSIYNLADLLVYPSLNEGFGLPALEAMACGTPVIASNLGSLPGVIGKAGILLAPKKHEIWAKEIQTLLQNPSGRERLAEAGRNRARQFSWQNTANKTFEVYQQVLNT